LAEAEPFICQLGKYINRTEEMEEKLLDQLLPLAAVRTGQVAAVQRIQFTGATSRKDQAFFNCGGIELR